MSIMLKIHHIDVGKGDSTLIIVKEGKNKADSGAKILQAVLIDGGDTGSVAQRILTYLKKKLMHWPDGFPGEPKLKTLDAIIATHYDKDHIFGLPTIIKSELCGKGTKIYDQGNCIVNHLKKVVFKHYIKAIEMRRSEWQKEAINIGLNTSYQEKVLKIIDEIETVNWNKFSKHLASEDIANINKKVKKALNGTISTKKLSTLLEQLTKIYEESDDWLRRVTKRVDSSCENFLLQSENNKIFCHKSNPDLPSMTCIAANRYVINKLDTQIDLYSSYGSDANQRSLAFMIRYNKFFYYTGGDICIPEEKKIAKYFDSFSDDQPLSAFKVSHHGSEHSTPDELVNTAIDPCVAFISYGNNSHKHPMSEVFQKLQNTMNIRKVYLTGNLDKNDQKAIENLKKILESYNSVVIKTKFERLWPDSDQISEKLKEKKYIDSDGKVLEKSFFKSRLRGQYARLDVPWNLPVKRAIFLMVRKFMNTDDIPWPKCSEVWDKLVDKGYINGSGNIQQAFFDLTSPYAMDIPYHQIIIKAVFDTIINQISRSYIKDSYFRGLYPKVEKVWDKLVDKGYINGSGNIQQAFIDLESKTDPVFYMDLVYRYALKQQIYDILFKKSAIEKTEFENKWPAENKVWSKLQEKGYIDGSGNIKEAFFKLLGFNDMELDYCFNIKREIYDIVKGDIGRDSKGALRLVTPGTEVLTVDEGSSQISEGYTVSYDRFLYERGNGNIYKQDFYEVIKSIIEERKKRSNKDTRNETKKILDLFWEKLQKEEYISENGEILNGAIPDTVFSYDSFDFGNLYTTINQIINTNRDLRSNARKVRMRFPGDKGGEVHKIVDFIRKPIERQREAPGCPKR